jgi:hypothetical protein
MERYLSPSRKASYSPQRQITKPSKNARQKSPFHQTDHINLDNNQLKRQKGIFRTKMGGRDDAGTPDPAEKGFATLATLRYGRLILILLLISMKGIIYTVAYTYYVYRIGVKAMVEKVILFTCITTEIWIT